MNEGRNYVTDLYLLVDLSLLCRCRSLLLFPHYFASSIDMCVFVGDLGRYFFEARNSLTSFKIVGFTLDLRDVFPPWVRKDWV